MGRVVTEIRVVNAIDEANAASGLVPADRVRAVTLPDVLVDTGATMLCLPQAIIGQLGLPVLRMVTVRTANGARDMPLYEHAKITVEGRSGSFECVALGDDAEPLLGLIPLETLGLELDLQNQRLRVLPDQGSRSYVLAPSPRIIG